MAKRQTRKSVKKVLQKRRNYGILKEYGSISLFAGFTEGFDFSADTETHGTLYAACERADLLYRHQRFLRGYQEDQGKLPGDCRAVRGHDLVDALIRSAKTVSFPKQNIEAPKVLTLTSSNGFRGFPFAERTLDISGWFCYNRITKQPSKAQRS